MIVREHINFERGLDPKDAMGIGMLSEIKKWIQSVTNFPYKDKNTALITAAAYGKIKYAKYLLDIGADINTLYSLSNDGPLFYAIANEEKAMAKYLLKRGADPTKILFTNEGNVAESLIKYMNELNMPIPIKEHMNFQRGLDPKVAMGIGNLYWGRMGTAGWKIDAKNPNDVKVKVGTSRWIKMDDYLKRYGVRCVYDEYNISKAWIKYIGQKEDLIKLWYDLFDRKIDDNGYDTTSRNKHLFKISEIDRYIK